MSRKVLDAIPELTARARAAMKNAYAPYSKFRVGAALLSKDGTIFAGCNVENASYPAGTCHRAFDAVVIVSDATTATPPCGICRQALAEFGLGLKVIAVTKRGRKEMWILKQLLPDAFTPSSLTTK
jgi:cytidine deaminase